MTKVSDKNRLKFIPLCVRLGRGFKMTAILTGSFGKWLKIEIFNLMSGLARDRA